MQKSSFPAVLIIFVFYSTQLSFYLDASMGSPHMQLIGQALKANGD